MSNTLDKVLDFVSPQNINGVLDGVESVEYKVSEGINWGGHKVAELMRSTDKLEIPGVAKHILKTTEGLAASATLFFLGSWVAAAHAITAVAKLAMDGLKYAYYKLHSDVNYREYNIEAVKTDASKHFEDLKANLIRFVSFKVNALILAFESIIRPTKVANDLADMDFSNNLFIGIPLNKA